MVCFFSLSCGNPKISYHVTRVNLFQSIRNYSANEQVAPQTALVSEDLSKHRVDWISMYKSSDYDIFFRTLDPEKNSGYLEGIGIPLKTIARLPESHYFLYNLVYRGKKPLKMSFYNSYFQDELKRRYEPISKKEFEERYTSSFYSWLDYNKLHHIYAEEIDPTNKTKKKYKALNKKPAESARVTPKSSVFQIVSYPFFSLASKRYNLFFRFQIGDVTKEVKTPLYYLSTRDDISEK